ncbi:MAG: C1 family peptidase [Acutalibacteraceae bacterium]|nr:C1 family peptidase [Acutalibacteraceae bacterium]
MKHKSFLRRMTAALLSCTLCCTGMTVPAISAEDTELPARFDWREEAPEILTPVKTQIEGTCWAYSAIACAESNLIKKGLADSDLDLSESHLMWFCSGQPAPTDPDDPCYGCTNNPYGTKAYTTVPGLGGYDPVDACLAAWQGVVPESDAAPHSAKEPLDESLRYQSIAHLQNVDYFDETDTQNTKTQLMNRGPLRWGFYVNHKYPLSEQGGYYFPDFSREELSEGKYTGGWHAVVLVGWDDNFPKENFTHKAPGNGAWIIRNSYGENYKNSDHGYIYISYYEPSLSYIAHYDFEPVTNYGEVHHYNSSQLRTQSLKSTYDLGFLVANVFEAEKPEKIAAVGLFTEAPSEPYEISVYALEPGFTNPQDGTLIETVDGIAEYKGFHTVKLPQSYAVDQGQMYSVVIETPPKQNDKFYMDLKCYKKGVSYIGFYTAKNRETPVWRDCYDESYGDVCVHVYTEYEGETAQILRGDMNRDGRLTAADLSLMKQVIRQPERSDLYQPAADWNGDSEINAADAWGLLAFLLGLPDNSLGLSPQMFRAALPGVEVTIDGDSVLQTGTVSGQDYTLTLNLPKWEKHTTPEQLVTLSRLFWQCYPRMWARYADISGAPSEVTLAVENEGYEVASAGGSFVHLHDQWLERYPEDFDCITHELAHVIQNGWDGNYLEDSGYIERFADCSRYEYAMDSGYYNDGEWGLQTVADESTRSTSVRFLVWLDYNYSDADTDILRNFLDVCRNRKIPPVQWESAWAEVFAGTKLAGKTVGEVWAMFAASDFANLSSYSDHGSGSELLAQYPIREKVRQRES